MLERIRLPSILVVPDDDNQLPESLGKEISISDEIYNSTLEETEKILSVLISDVNNNQPIIIGSNVISTTNFKASEAEQLDINIGDIIIILEAPKESDWLFGVASNGKKGWFPRSSVEIIQKIDKGSSSISLRSISEKLEQKGLDKDKRSHKAVKSDKTFQDSASSNKNAQNIFSCELLEKDAKEKEKKRKWFALTMKEKDKQDSAGSLKRGHSFFNNSAKNIEGQKTLKGQQMNGYQTVTEKNLKIDETVDKSSKNNVQNVLTELLKTEKIYNASLKFIINDILHPISINKCLSTRHIQMVFGNIEILDELSSSFVHDLEDLIECYDTQKLALFFAKMVLKVLIF